MDIGAVLSKAWQIVWKNKILWIFGILASCGSVNGNQSNYRMGSEDVSVQTQQWFNQLPDWQIALMVGAIILVTLIIIVLVIFLSTMGKVGLVRGTLQADQGATKLSFGELFNGSLPYFWRVFGLNLLVGLVAFVFAIAGLLAAVLGTAITFGLALLCIIPLVCLLIPVGWVVSVVVEQSINAIVVENLGVMDGLRRGWEVVKENAGNYVVMSLILFLGVGLIGGFIITLPIALVAIPAMVSLFSGEQVGNSGFWISGLCFLGYLPFLLALSGLLQSFTSASWTLTFMRLTGKTAFVEPLPAPVELS